MTSPDRRQAIVDLMTVNGVDFVEVDPSSDTLLNVYFILNLPGTVTEPGPGIHRPGAGVAR